MVDIAADVVDLIGEIETAAMTDPISGFLVLVGGLIILGSVAVMSWLTIGGVLSVIRSSLG